MFSTPKTWAARWYEDYESAVEKIKAGQCSSEAIENLGAAVVDKPKPQLGKRTYAQRRINYLPYLMLVRAHLLCGNIELASRYLEKSRSFGVAPSEELESLERQIETRKTPPTPTPAPTPTVPAVDPEVLNQRYDATMAAISQARDALGDYSGDIEEAKDLIGDRLPGFKEFETRSRARLEAISQEAGKARDHEDLLSLADTLTRATSLTLEIQKSTRDLETIRREHERIVLASRATPSPSPSPEHHPPGETPPPPVREKEIPDALYRAAVAYFSGDYSSVVHHLESINDQESSTRAAEFLLRGAGRFNLAQIEGDQKRKELLALARDDLAQVKALAKGMKPDPELFPPGLVQLFEQAR